MNSITAQQITEAFQKFNQIADSQIDAHIQAFTSQQEVLFAYVMTIDDELTEDERQAMLMVAIQIWFVITQNFTSIKIVTPELLDEIDQKNDALLDQLAQENDDEATTIEKLLAQHPQPHLLDMVVACLQDEEISETPLSEESINFMFIYLLNFLDALLVSVEKS